MLQPGPVETGKRHAVAEMSLEQSAERPAIPARLLDDALHRLERRAIRSAWAPRCRSRRAGRVTSSRNTATIGFLASLATESSVATYWDEQLRRVPKKSTTAQSSIAETRRDRPRRPTRNLLQVAPQGATGPTGPTGPRAHRALTGPAGRCYDRRPELQVRRRRRVPDAARGRGVEEQEAWDPGRHRNGYQARPHRAQGAEQLALDRAMRECAFPPKEDVRDHCVEALLNLRLCRHVRVRRRTSKRPGSCSIRSGRTTQPTRRAAETPYTRSTRLGEAPRDRRCLRSKRNDGGCRAAGAIDAGARQP